MSRMWYNNFRNTKLDNKDNERRIDEKVPTSDFKVYGA